QEPRPVGRAARVGEAAPRTVVVDQGPCGPRGERGRRRAGAGGAALARAALSGRGRAIGSRRREVATADRFRGTATGETTRSRASRGLQASRANKLLRAARPALNDAGSSHSSRRWAL